MSDTSNHEHDAPGVLRSQERLQVGTDVRVSGRAVLRKFIVTETVTETFEIRREEVRLDYEPVSDTDNPIDDGPAFDDRVIEVVLHREVPVFSTKIEAVERVRLHVDTVTGHVPVSEELRTEHVDVHVAKP